MDLVDKQNIPGVEVGQQRRQIPRLLDGRARGNADLHAHLIGDDPRQGGFAQAGRAVEQHVVQGLIAPPGGLDIDREIALGLLLSGIVGQQPGPETELAVVQGRQRGGHQRGLVVL